MSFYIPTAILIEAREGREYFEEWKSGIHATMARMLHCYNEHCSKTFTAQEFNRF